MAYKVTTPAQRVILCHYIDLWRFGRVVFAGPRPSDGMMIAVRRLPDEVSPHFIDRDGKVLSPSEVEHPNYRDFDSSLEVRRG